MRDEVRERFIQDLEAAIASLEFAQEGLRKRDPDWVVSFDSVNIYIDAIRETPEYEEAGKL